EKPIRIGREQRIDCVDEAVGVHRSVSQTKPQSRTENATKSVMRRSGQSGVTGNTIMSATRARLLRAKKTKAVAVQSSSRERDCRQARNSRAAQRALVARQSR